MTQQVVKIKSIKHVTHDVLQITTEKPRQLDFTPGPKRRQPGKSNLQTIISIVFGSLLPKALLTPDLSVLLIR